MLASKHNPNGTSPHFANEAIESAISAYQAGTNPTTALAEIVKLTQPRVQTLIRFHKTSRYRSEDELPSDVNFRLLRAVDKFDPTKGSAFSFISSVVMNTLCTSVTRARAVASRYVELDETFAGTLPAKQEDHTALEDMKHRIRLGVKTILTCELELEAQRWLVESFVDDGFTARRHECSDAAMMVYGLSHARSRELYDLVMLEVRRVLYSDLKGREPIPAGRLIGTRSAWIARYAALMDAEEFTRFFVLMRDLAPYVLLLVDPQNSSHRPDRCPPVSRRNIELVLYGCDDAVPLFSHPC